jgi:hypothetical protein
MSDCYMTEFVDQRNYIYVCMYVKFNRTSLLWLYAVEISGVSKLLVDAQKSKTTFSLALELISNEILYAECSQNTVFLLDVNTCSSLWTKSTSCLQDRGMIVFPVK